MPVDKMLVDNVPMDKFPRKGSKILVTKPWADGEFDEDESLDTIESDGAMGNGRSLEGSQAVIQTASLKTICPVPCSGCRHFDPRECRAGVSVVRDGCGCCNMCARQQGDLCDEMYLCDEKKGLYCDPRQHGSEAGICRAREAKNCVHRGKTYRDGNYFRPDCSEICLCQNGQVTCSTSCPHEFRRPSPHNCRQPHLVAIAGRCCKEWVCPHVHSLPEPSAEPTPKCVIDDGKWSPCSKSCGVGISLRHTNNNARCKLKRERRLCFVRPCDMNDSHLKESSCHRSWPEEQGHFIYNPLNGCTSVDKHYLRFCSTCKTNKCCIPHETKTKDISFRCPDRKIVTGKFMWIKSCECVRKSRCPYK